VKKADSTCEQIGTAFLGARVEKYVSEILDPLLQSSALEFEILECYKPRRCIVLDTRSSMWVAVVYCSNHAINYSFQFTISVECKSLKKCLDVLNGYCSMELPFLDGYQVYGTT
jgi:hypothetical protein